MTLVGAYPLPSEKGVMRPIVGIVDADPSILRALQRLLGTAGFTVKTFGSAEELLASDQLDQIRCLALDIHLDGLSGFDLQERLAAAHSRMPIIFITALDDVRTRERARRAGAVDYLRKPFDEQALIGAINRALDQA